MSYGFQLSHGTDLRHNEPLRRNLDMFQLPVLYVLSTLLDPVD